MTPLPLRVKEVSVTASVPLTAIPSEYAVVGFLGHHRVGAVDVHRAVVVIVTPLLIWTVTPAPKLSVAPDWTVKAPVKT